MARILRAEYDQLSKIAKVFGSESSNVKGSIDRLNRQIDVLEGGDWIGEGANAFYNEMRSEVMPAMQRLMRALAMASQITGQVIQILREAEEESASQFSGFLNSIGDAGAADFRQAGAIAMAEAGQGASTGGGSGGAGGGGGAAEASQPSGSGGGGGASGGGAGGGGGGGGGGSWDGEIGYRQEKQAPGGGKPASRTGRRRSSR